MTGQPTGQRKHVDRVLQSVGSGRAAAQSRLAASWQRSFARYGLDPARRDDPGVVDETGLRLRREAMDRFLQIAAPKLDQLFGLIGHSGCGVLLTDAGGIVLDQRCRDADAAVFRSWGLMQGADWSEAAEGTNGIGTCLAEMRQLTIHRDEHYMARNIGMSCMDAPIYGPDGTVVAALDVSSARADQTEAFNRLIEAMVAQTARQIETDTFRASFPAARIVVADSDDTGGAVLLAVDSDDIIVGATREARRCFELETAGPLTPRPASDLLGREDEATGFERAERAAVNRALARAGGNVSEAARALGVGRATLYRRMKRLGIG
ncbi:helix-turn-helix domain-containing protein [Psychromarinibacter halotolerans]|uniref:GAF domain-containing protein n=1 Tax=Psychromarinibacter halotolerans TaxID=1775175 RepID=A0ABV7GPT9_9RHOB|nr:helix-turn-helix domain-containing protein [Psychromarinibacter halotolerans]MDF0594455.1 helix-turn-helix domain-containing protein [Psychromarinibacter halotolerans]